MGRQASVIGYLGSPPLAPSSLILLELHMAGTHVVLLVYLPGSGILLGFNLCPQASEREPVLAAGKGKKLES